MLNFLFVLILIAHLIVAGSTQKIINRSRLLTPARKRTNTWLNWLLPFLWSAIVRHVIAPLKGPKVKTKASRRKRRWGRNTDNWQNLTGGGGGNWR